MNPIEILKQEHEQIERELIELETIMQEFNINYPNLIHVFKKLHDLWNSHEEKEEKIFPALKNDRIIIPVKKRLFEHISLRPHKTAINKAIMSGSNEDIKNALENHGRVIVERLRAHIDFEDEILYTIALEEFKDEELKQLSESLE